MESGGKTQYSTLPPAAREKREERDRVCVLEVGGGGQCMALLTLSSLLAGALLPSFLPSVSLSEYVCVLPA